MKQIELRAQDRVILGKKVKNLRTQGWIPAVIYGPNIDSRHIQIDATEAVKVVNRASSSQLININIEGDNPVQVLIRDYQEDPIRRELLHVDLYQVDMTQEVTAEVPLVLVGESPVIEQRQGIFTQMRDSIEISCLPQDLIDGVEVDLTELEEVHDQITVGELAFPKGVNVLTDPEEILVRINPLEEIVEEEEEEELFEFISEVTAEPEVISRGKDEEEEMMEEEAYE